MTTEKKPTLLDWIRRKASLKKSGVMIDQAINEVEGMFNKSDRRKTSKIKILTIVILMILSTSNIFLTMMIFDKERTFTKVISELFRPTIPVITMDIPIDPNGDIDFNKPDDLVSFVAALMRRNAELEIEMKLLQDKIKALEPFEKKEGKDPRKYVEPSKYDLIAVEK